MTRRAPVAAVALFATLAAPRGARAQAAVAPSAEGAVDVEVRGATGPAPRGVGDVRVDRELLTASPRVQTSEMLSAAPGFFVDHEDGEGVGNDVYLRGFDLDHGSGIEMRLGSVPINVPTHIQGQGYADANFIIPEVVRSVRVIEGPYDPQQGDAAIVGSASFDLGVAERGYQLKTTFGSFGNARVVGIVAPPDTDDETFAAFALRRTDGFGPNRAAQSGSTNAQWGFDLTPRDHLRVVATAYGARSLLASVVRQDDVDAGRVGYYDSYPTGPGFFAGGQSIQATRAVVGAELSHAAAGRFTVAPWFMWTDSRSRQNYTGDLETSQIDPAQSGKGDLFELANREAAAGVSAGFRSPPLPLGRWAAVAIEPGTYVRFGHTEQAKSLLDPNAGLAVWDRRVDAGLDTLDAGGFVDLGVTVFGRLRLSGGPRADLLVVSVDDHLAGVGSSPSVAAGASMRSVDGIAAGPRLSASWEIARGLSASASYGEGFRSLDVTSLRAGATPYSKVRSLEAGFRARTADDRYATSLAFFQTEVGNELVFEAAAGGLETENASVRRGMVGSLVARPWGWLLVSSALSITRATFETLVAGVGHFVPSVPPVLFRTDATGRARLATWRGKPIVGRVGVGYTFLSPRHLTDAVAGPASHVLSAKAAARWTWIEIGVDAYNLLALRYADDAQYYVSNWSTQPGQHLASDAVHLTAAPPLTLLGSMILYF